MKIRAFYIILVCLAGLGLWISRAEIYTAIIRNSLALQIIHTNSPQQWIGGPQKYASDQNCQLYYLSGIIADDRHEIEQRDRLWSEAVKCSPDYAVWIHRWYPEDHALAQKIHTAQPLSAEAWFWLGDLEPENKIDYYQQGLSLSPTDGLRWNTLGYDLRNANRQEEALAAYAQGCYNGDIGSNGCLNAGIIAEKMENYPLAIYYYHLSHYPPARKKGQELEKQFQLTPQP